MWKYFPDISSNITENFTSINTVRHKTMNKAFSLKSGFTRTNYSDFSAKYNQAYEWFNSFGFKTSATRLGKYKKHIDELSKLYESKELSTANLISIAFYQERAKGQLQTNLTQLVILHSN